MSAHVERRCDDRIFPQASRRKRRCIHCVLLTIANLMLRALGNLRILTDANRFRCLSGNSRVRYAGCTDYAPLRTLSVEHRAIPRVPRRRSPDYAKAARARSPVSRHSGSKANQHHMLSLFGCGDTRQAWGQVVAMVECRLIRMRQN